MMSGVPIGKVSNSTLIDGGRQVQIDLDILSKIQIPKDGVFHIDSLGFLGDKYIEVSLPLQKGSPNTNATEIYKDGDTIAGETPFNEDEAVRSISGLLDQAKQTMKDLDQAITNVNRTVLSPDTLGDFSKSIINLQAASATAMKVASAAEVLFDTNSPTIRIALTNFEGFSEKLKLAADQLNDVIATNQAGIGDAVKNLRDTTATFKKLASDVDAGKGLAGALLKDESLKMQMSSLLTNADAMASNFATFGSNLNTKGIWGVFRQPKPPKKSPAPAH
jgi:phospholipid/cholesterol/gamma-HCH transport system substrate-binding protein